MPALSDDETGPVEELPELAAGWRIEVTRAGKFWQWRKGSGNNRKSMYGGRFAMLPQERQEAYERNKRRAAGEVEGNDPGAGAGAAPERAVVLPEGRVEG